MTFCFIKILFHLLALLSTFKMHKAERLLAQELCTVSLVQVILQVPSPQTCQSAYSHIWKSGVSPRYFRGLETVDQTVTRKTSTGHHNQKHSKKVFRLGSAWAYSQKDGGKALDLSGVTNSFVSEWLEVGLNVFPENGLVLPRTKVLKEVHLVFFCFLKWALLLMPYL